MKIQKIRKDKTKNVKPQTDSYKNDSLIKRLPPSIHVKLALRTLLEEKNKII